MGSKTDETRLKSWRRVVGVGRASAEEQCMCRQSGTKSDQGLWSFERAFLSPILEDD